MSVTLVEDKIVQRAATAVLNAIYEKTSSDDALDALVVGLTRTKVNYILDADIRSFLDPVSYCPLVHEVMRTARVAGLSP